MADTFQMSACIQLVTLPLTVYFYYEFPVYSILINGLLLPFMGLLLVSGILGGLAGLYSRWLGAILLKPAYGLLKGNEWVCGLFAKLPGAMWITGKPPVWMMTAYYIVLGISLAVSYRNRSKDSQQTIHMKRNEGTARKMKVLPVSWVLAALLVLLTLRPGSRFEVCFLDVGQGDGIYIQNGEGSSFFVDGGSSSQRKVGEYRILSFLKCRGVDHVDGWFVSHADTDHISGLLELWENGYRIDHLFLAEGIVRDEAWEELCAMADKYDTAVTYLRPGDFVSAGNMKLTCLFPFQEGTDRNTSSMVLQLDYYGMTGIFTGDISSEEEQELIRQYPGLRADLYKAAHHGSDHSNSESFLETLGPVVTVISCGVKNSYGHPGKEAVSRIEGAGSQIYYTMKSGQITIGCDKRGIWCRTYRE